MDSKSNNNELDAAITAQKKFFIQRWLEALNQHTHSSYYINYLNSHVALKEIYNVAGEILQGKTKTYHLSTVIKEAKDLIGKDQLFEKKEKPLYDRVIRALEKKEYNLYSLTYQIKGAIVKLEKYYLKWLLDELRYYLIFPEPPHYPTLYKELKSIDKLIEMVISELIYKGWTTEGLYGVIYGFLLRYKNSKDKTFFYNPKEWDNLFSILQSPETNFLCAFPFESKISQKEKEKLELVNLNLLTGDKILDNYKHLQGIERHIQKDNIYILETRTAHDRFSAMSLSWRDISKKFDLLTFYGKNYEKPSTKPLVIVPERTRYHKRKEEASTFYSIKPAETPISLIQQALKILESGLPSNSEKIENLLEFTRISQESLSPQSTFLNLWIALEFFVKSKEFDSDLQSVLEVVSATVTSRYIYDLVENFYDDCQRCGVKDFIRQSKSQQKVSKMLSILIDDNLSANLLKECHEINILLGYRCRSLHEIIKKKANVTNKIENHLKKVKYQVNRLYRVRNSIVHTADTSKNLWLFTRNLKEYLQKTVKESVFRINQNPGNTLEEIHSLIKESPLAIVDVLKNIDKDDIGYYKEVLMKGVTF